MYYFLNYIITTYADCNTINYIANLHNKLFEF